MKSPHPNVLSAFLSVGVMTCFLQHVYGQGTFSQSQSYNGLAELAVWESLGISDADFDSADTFVTSLGLGSSPDYENGVKFLLFNRANRETANGTQIKADPEYLKKTLNPEVPTKIFIHGFQNDASSDASVTIKNAYLDHGDYNMIIVDWGPLAVPPNYVAARSHAVGVANLTAELMNALADSGICAPKDQHILGHSLGGQIAGLASGSAKTKPGRCTGFDPAGPLFQVSTNAGRIDPSDADLVDVIHTTAALWGFPSPVGHIDFYPNGGVWPQPGCTLDIDGNCSHVMSVKFFAYTISHPNAFVASRCQTHAIIRGACPSGTENATMGEYLKFDTPGMYYLDAKLDN